MAMTNVAVNVLAAFALCVLAVTLGLLLAPNLSLAAVIEWLTTQPPSPCACVFTGD